ncbi:MAG: class D sortase [Oscillospiraceae bacterium]|nr:class D sortase [Oscillospiraceae bacterium]
MRKTIKIMLVVLLLLAIVAGALFLSRASIIDAQRAAVEDELIARIESGQTQLGEVNVHAVEGEESEFAEIAGPEPVEVTGYGVISIPAIELTMPVVEGADSYSLRAAVGWLPESAEMGSAGNCVIFGHRMYEYGRHFNRLDELREGDSIILYDAKGSIFTYTVTGTETIEPDTLMDTLAGHNEGFGLTLVTCTPTKIATHRLLVYATLEAAKFGK